ncbi:MAG: hypothetical protein QM607_04240 [Microbacterium sp.]
MMTAPRGAVPASVAMLLALTLCSCAAGETSCAALSITDAPESVVAGETVELTVENAVATCTDQGEAAGNGAMSTVEVSLAPYDHPTDAVATADADVDKATATATVELDVSEGIEGAYALVSGGEILAKIEITVE